MNIFHKIKNIFPRRGRQEEYEDEFLAEENEFTEELQQEEESNTESEKPTDVENPEPKKNSKSMKNKAPAVKKKIIAFSKGILILGLFGVFVFLGHLMFATPAPATNNNQAEENELGDVKEYTLNPEILKVNPFIKVNNFVASDEHVQATRTPSQRAGSLPIIPSVRTVAAPSYSGTLPVIPSAPSNIPRPSLPPVPSSNASSATTTAPPSGGGHTATVQGVFTGSDGNNMAIMSDGSIVGEGETYNDNRIAYIGGDGIQFDNGSSMKYGNQ